MVSYNNATDYQATQYNVLTGGATNLLNNVAPSSTSGVPLISQGAASQPVFGTAVVAGGGTGDTSFTAYAPVCGGTTTTGVLQSASTGISTAGFILTSTGASSLPTWQVNSGPGTFLSVVIQTFTSSGTYTPTSGMAYCIIELVGGGGGGGGASTSDTNKVSNGGGGAAGGYARKAVSAATIGASQTVTIGNAGAGGSAGANAGGDGGTTSVGVIVSATGGHGGGGSGNAGFNATVGGTGGSGSSGNVNITGGNGGFGFGVGNGIVSGGAGGNSFFAQGAIQTIIVNALSSSVGTAGYGYGAGGSGGASSWSSQIGGGAGIAGVVVITEFIH